MGSLPNLTELGRENRRYSDVCNNSKKLMRMKQNMRKTEISLLNKSFSVSNSPHSITHTTTQLSSIAAVAQTSSPAVVATESKNTLDLVARHGHRHSLSGGRRVLRTRSSGSPYNVWDESLIEQVAAYHAISSRSAHRLNNLSQHYPQALPLLTTAANLQNQKRRDSMSSSIGTNSIRRLLALKGRTCRHKISVHIRSEVYRSFSLVAITHLISSAILLPLFALQGSNSIWYPAEEWFFIEPNIGSLLLSVVCLISAATSFKSASILRKFHIVNVLVIHAAVIVLFLICHLYPTVYTLPLAYIMLGCTLGPAYVAQLALIVYFATRLTGGYSSVDCNSASENLDENKFVCNRNRLIRRFARWLQASKDLGIIAGALLTFVILSWKSGITLHITSVPLETSVSTIAAGQSIFYERLNPQINNSMQNNITDTQLLKNQSQSYIEFTDMMFNVDEHGERICGADGCPPIWNSLDTHMRNLYQSRDLLVQRTENLTNLALIISYLIISIVAAVLIAIVRKKDKVVFRETSSNQPNIVDTLMFVGPISYFIGTEQAYMLADFSKNYITCSIGISGIAGAILGMGIMQSTVSCTLSMLLRYTKRAAVIGAGFFFHACLLLVLSLWKPSKDDSALFYVIAAAWGACDAMWETLIIVNIILNHNNHVTEIVCPLQAIRFLGLGVTFAVHGYLCEGHKILILGIILLVSLPPYAMLETRLEKQRKMHNLSI